ncbi:hypothetical protein GCM10022254_58440 [Actinomadura meridiana]|uniref:Uncharacterized protein n=1 Tax=Actinomadura meridiana TaxID=559626 RepID=A0ABP8CH46_9ACTN
MHCNKQEGFRHSGAMAEALDMVFVTGPRDVTDFNRNFQIYLRSSGLPRERAGQRTTKDPSWVRP